VSCVPEQVTALVDGELAEEARAALESHVAGCQACRAQAEDERALRERLRTLPPVEARPRLERAVRWQIARARSRRRRVASWIGLAASLVLALLWARAMPAVLARELLFDHAKCFSRPKLPAHVWSGDGLVVTQWLESHGEQPPGLPDQVGGLTLVGARFCPLAGISRAAHVYYASRERHASLFVLDRALRMDGEWQGRVAGRSILILRVGGRTVGLVAEHEEDVLALRQSFRSISAELLP
jgi:anti-sigma factor RsiW